MTISDALFMWPETVGGWAALVLAVILIVAAIGGVVVGLQRRNIRSEVYRGVHTEVPPVVALCLREVNAKLDGIRINQAELSAEVGRVRVLEAKIDNGLTSKVEKIETRQTVLVDQVSEMHGWLKAKNGWNGKDRRTT